MDRLKPRLEEVTVPGWGTLWIRSCPPTKRIKRGASYVDKKGNQLPDAREREAAHMLIDQVYENPETPMFTDKDFEFLMEADAYRLDPLYEAVVEFNFGDPSEGK